MKLSNASFAKVGADPKAVAETAMKRNPAKKCELVKYCFKVFLPQVVVRDWTYCHLNDILLVFLTIIKVS